MTLQQLLEEGIDELKCSGSPDAELDARQCLMAAFDLDMVHFLLDRMRDVGGSESGSTEADSHGNQVKVETYRSMIARRASRTPLQQILGCQEFMGLEFYVNEHVLIPRQDTETLVELVLEEQGAKEHAVEKQAAEKPLVEKPVMEKPDDTGKSLLDLCTGSGCIAISLAVKGNFQSVTAADLSEEALKVARRNAENLGAAIRFCQGDLFGALQSETRKGKEQSDEPQHGVAQSNESQNSAKQSSVTQNGTEAVAIRFDIITSNPPYIPTAVVTTLEPEVRDHEPMMALDGMEDGLYFYRKIAAEAGNYLNPGGAIYLEIGYDQGEAVSKLLTDAGFTDVRVHKDLPGNDRVVRGTWTLY